MRIPASLALAVVALALVGCGHVRTTTGTTAALPSPAAHTATSTATVTSSSTADPGSTGTEVEADGRFSLVVFDRTSGKPLVNENPTARYPAESVVKLLIAVVALEKGDDVSLVATMLMMSDDEIANQLWTRYGNVAIVYRAIDLMGLSGVVAPEDPGRWGDTQLTAEDVVKIYQYVLDRAPKNVSATIMKALGGTAKQAADNFYQYYGIADAEDDHDWAVKEGWACCKPDRVLHSTGVVGDDQRYIVAALSAHDSDTSTWDQVGGELTEAVRRALAAVRG